MNQKNRPYLPIDCSFYDRLEHYATLKSYIQIRFNDTQNQIIETRDRIVDLVQKDKVEYLILESYDKPIRLDELMEVDGYKLPTEGSSC
jgi:Rho-binding antiterminator